MPRSCPGKMTSFQTLFEDRGNPGIELVTRLGFTEEIHFFNFSWLAPSPWS